MTQVYFHRSNTKKVFADRRGDRAYSTELNERCLHSDPVTSFLSPPCAGLSKSAFNEQMTQHGMIIVI